ncbi:hypothetical protein [Synechococcus sp. UW179A]|uniref:hypothetical protein n=1 Tax=Synechococcus sp. UW179A TaxID=2575510 RepID=UPI00148300EF|nr:hypothetical protein [Synechococcus sp. UW179A]
MVSFSSWYESKSLIEQGLVDLISDRTQFIDDQKEVDSFLLILADYNISTSAQFLDLFFSEYKGTEGDVLEQFVKDWMSLSRGCLPKLLLKRHNPEQLWQSLIHLDFYKIVFNGNTYLFKRHL